MPIISKALRFLVYENLTMFLILTLLVVVLIDEYFRRRRWRKFPYSLPTLPVIGSIHCFVGKKDLLDVYAKWFNKFRAPFHCRAFYEEFYFTMDSEEIRKVLLATECLDKGAPYDLFKAVTPNSILIADEDIWKRKRRAFSKMFSQMRLTKLFPHMNLTADKVVKVLAVANGGNLRDIMEKIIQDGAIETFLGCDKSVMDHPLITKLDMCGLLKLMMRGTIYRYVRPWLYFNFICSRTSEGKALAKRYEDFSDALSYIMKIRRDVVNNQKEEDREGDLLTIAVEENMNQQEVIADVITFLYTAAETTTVTVGLALILLSIDRNFQDELYREVMDVIGDAEYIDYEHISKLKFTEMVLNETLRIFPSVPLIVRRINRDIDLGDKVLSKNTNVVVSIFGVHRSEKYWENPLEFNPYRFLPSEVGKRGTTTYMPFSVGPRNCIGGKYGMMVMKLTLAKIIRSLEVSSHYKSVDEIKVYSFVSMNIDDIECNFTPRT